MTRPGRIRRNERGKSTKQILAERLEDRIVLSVEGLSPSIAPPSFEALNDFSNDTAPAAVHELVNKGEAVPINWGGQDVFAVPNEWIVKFSDNPLTETKGIRSKSALAAAQDLLSVSQGYAKLSVGVDPKTDSLIVERAMTSENTFVVSTPPIGTASTANVFSQIPHVEYAEPNFIVWATRLPDDPAFDQLWGLENTGQLNGTEGADIGATEFWDVSVGSSDVIVADIDTGIDYDHEDLAANMWVNPGEIAGDGIDNDNNGFIDDIYGIDTFNTDADPADGDGHGTHTSGTIGAVGNNEIGVTGVAWNVRLMAVKFLSDSGTGTSEGAINAVNYVTQMKRDYGQNIVASNNSWGGGGFSRPMADAIQAGVDEGIMFVAAAGNSGTDNDRIPFYPANYEVDGIISVAATDRNDELAGFSQFGATTVDLAAPGVEVYSTLNGGQYGDLSGTSMATPHVTGAVALAKSVFPDATLEEIKSAILGGVDPVDDLTNTTLSGGRLNLVGMIRELGMSVDSSDPANGSVTFEPLRDFTITFAHPVNPSSVEPADLVVNGRRADSFTIVAPDRIVFRFNTSPITSEGMQSMSVAAGAVTRLADGEGTVAYDATFRYDQLPMEVVATTPTDGSLVQLPLVSYEIDLNEPFSPASLSRTDLVLSQGEVVSAIAVGADTIRFTLSGVENEGDMSLTLPAGALTDLFDNPMEMHRTEITLDHGTVAFPTPLEGLRPGGSLAYRGEAVGNIGNGSDADRFLLPIDADQQLTLSVDSISPLRPHVELIGPSGATIAEASATSPGSPITLSSIDASEAGVYQIVMSSEASTAGEYSIQVLLNGALEIEEISGSSNNSIATAELLVFNELGDGTSRSAVFGVAQGGAQIAYEANMDSNPGWSLNTGWEYGQPSGGGNNDPDSGFNGPNVIGYNLSGDYENNIVVPRYATTPAFDASDLTGTTLTFQRWLGIESSNFDHARIQVSTNGTQWSTVWEHSGGDFEDIDWVPQTFDISSFADGQSDVRVRWGMGTTDGSRQFGGWNIDDVVVFGEANQEPDIYRIELVAGESATLMAGSSTGLAITSMTLTAADGTVLAQGNRSKAGLVVSNFVAPTSGSYYVNLAGVGEYSFVVVKNADLDTEPNDGSESLLDSSNSQDITLVGRVLGSVGDTAQLIASEIEPNDDGQPDASLEDLTFANDISGSFEEIGGDFVAEITGGIQIGDDRDWDFFKVFATPGDNMQIELRGARSGRGTLTDPFLRLFDRNANLLASNDDTFDLESFIEFDEFVYEGDYYIVADSFQSAIGTYTLTVTHETDNPPIGEGANDYYSFQANAGDQITIQTSTPGDGPFEFANSLDPGIEVFHPDQSRVSLSNTTGNELATITASQSGTHYVRVFAENETQGDYVLDVSGNTAALPDFEIVSIEPSDGARFRTAPDSITVRFGADLSVPSVDGFDLFYNGIPTTDVEVIDARTAVFPISNSVEGTNSVIVVGGTISSLQGQTNQPFTSQIFVDSTPPRINEATVTRDVTLGAGVSVLSFTFNEAISTERLDEGDFRLSGQISGPLSPASMDFDETTNTLNIEYPELADDKYTITLFSGDERFEDLVGNDLDGEGSGLLPSGNGAEGGNYVVEFTVDAIESSFPLPLSRQEPFGSLVFERDVRGIIESAVDSDSYTIELNAGQQISLRAQGTNMRPLIRLTDPNNVSVSEFATSNGGHAILDSVPVSTAGTYTIQVSSIGGSGDEYNLQVALNSAFEAESFGGASNNTPAQAQTINDAFTTVDDSGTRAAIIGAISTSSDQDWYRVTLSSGTPSTIAVDGNVSVELFDAAGANRIATSIETENVDQMIYGFAPEISADYLVRITGAESSNYTLLVTQNVDLEREGNDNFDDAKPLDTGLVLGYLSAEPPAVSSNSEPQDKSETLGDSEPPDVDTKGEQEAKFVPNELLVGFTKDISFKQATAAVNDYGGAIKKQFETIHGGLVTLGDNTDVFDAIKQWSSFDWVEYAEPNYLLTKATTEPNDPFFDDLWALENTGQSGGTVDADIDASTAWDISVGSDDIVIAHLDTGVDYNHVDLVANMWVNPGEIPGDGIDNDDNGYIDDIHGIDTASNDSDPFDGDSHGTHVAGIAAATGNNEIGVSGVAWNAKIMALKFLDDFGSGTTSAAIQAIDYMTMMKRDYGVNIVVSNNSWGGGGFSQPLLRAIEASNQEGILFVAAAGNDSTNNDSLPYYPASYDLEGILAVAATNRNDQLAGFSHFGATSVDLAAPGVSIFSTLPNDSYGTDEGTSMATPYVSGAVALLAGISPSSTIGELKEIILDSVDAIPSLTGRTVTGGRLNVGQALESIVDSGDFYTFSAQAGDNLTITVKKPFAGNAEFENILDPAVELFDPSGSLVPYTNTSGAETLSHVATSSGDYTVRVFSSNQFGEYLLSVDGNTSDPQTFIVDSTSPENGATLSSAPGRYEVNFNRPISISSLQPGDFLVNGVPATSVAVIDGNTAEIQANFQIGINTVLVAPGAITDIQGNAIQSFSSEFSVDRSGPRIVSSTVSEGDEVAAGDLVIEIGFNEAIDSESLNGTEPLDRAVSLEGVITGSLPKSTTYISATNTVRIVVGSLPEDDFTLTLDSDLLRDLVGNRLDGEIISSPLPPNISGNGAPGGDFVVQFSSDIQQQIEVDDFVRLAPLGSFAYGSVGRTGIITSSNDTDAYHIFRHAGETLTFVATPGDTIGNDLLSRQWPASELISSGPTCFSNAGSHVHG